MKLKNITPIEPEMSRCISVDAPNRQFAIGTGSPKDAVDNATGVGADDIKTGTVLNAPVKIRRRRAARNRVLTHNSVVQQNIIIGCILRPESWRFLGIDLKRVELSGFQKYSEVVQGIATVLEDALTILRFAQQTMMKRYEDMESIGVNDFLNLPEKSQALMIMVDELTELLDPSGVKALSENTIIPTPYGPKKLKNLSIGDSVFDNYGKPTIITNKYIPEQQKSYTMKITSDKTDDTETIVSGAEHNWVVYFTYPNGEVEGPETVDTDYLYAFKAEQDKLPAEERTKAKFKRG